MGKIFITDEGDNAYVAQVTRGKRLGITNNTSTFVYLPSSAHTLVAATTAYGSACYIDKIIAGKRPGTAACLSVWNLSHCASSFSAFDQQSATNLVGHFHLDASGTVTTGDMASYYPCIIPIGVYCSSGIAIAISHSASTGKLGDVNCVTVVYHT